MGGLNGSNTKIIYKITAMKYFDKDSLDCQTIERVETTLDSLQNLINEHTIIEEYRQFYAKVQLELLDYYNDRLVMKATAQTHLKDTLSDLPF